MGWKRSSKLRNLQVKMGVCKCGRATRPGQFLCIVCKNITQKEKTEVI